MGGGVGPGARRRRGGPGSGPPSRLSARVLPCRWRSQRAGEGSFGREGEGGNSAKGSDPEGAIQTAGAAAPIYRSATEFETRSVRASGSTCNWPLAMGSRAGLRVEPGASGFLTVRKLRPGFGHRAIRGVMQHRLRRGYDLSPASDEGERARARARARGSEGEGGRGRETRERERQGEGREGWMDGGREIEIGR